MRYGQPVTPVVIAAMQAVIDNGKWITICSGRGYQQFDPLLDQLPNNAPLVCAHGALIIDHPTRRVLYEQPVPLVAVRETIRFAVENQLDLRAPLADLDTALEYHRSERSFVQTRARVVIRKLDDPFDVLERPPHKILMVVPPEQLLRLQDRLRERLRGHARVTASSRSWMDVVHPTVSKGDGMARVADYLGISQGETLAIGDSDNDVEMIEWAGLGVAMQDAMPAALAVANWVAPAVEEDGAALTLRRFMLEPQAAAASEETRARLSGPRIAEQGR
jgi:Cof subfamily protein (haloacid dehalogenase superfamily)